MSLIAAIDVGTTSLRVGLFDQGGNRQIIATAPVESLFPHAGWVEHDPMTLLRSCIDSVSQACTQVGVEMAAIDSVGIACQRGTFVAWNIRTGEPITPAIGWQDSRTQAQVDELRAGGIPVNTMASCTKIAWVLNEMPEAKAALNQGALRFGTVDTWLTWNLTDGQAFITDPSNAAATGLYDPGTGDWSTTATDFFGIDRSTLPAITVTAGRTGDDHEITTGETTIRAGVGDQQAACYAHGLGVGDAKLTLGTSAMLDVGIGSSPQPGPPGAYALPLWRLPTSHGNSSNVETVETYCMEANIAAAGATIEWLVRVGLLSSIEELDFAAPRGRPGPMIVPALAGLGTPHDTAAARGLFVGIGLDTTADDLVLAAVDGIALRAAELCEALDVGDTLKVDGGLTRSTTMLHRLADLTGRTVLPSVDPEVTLRGAAMLAALGEDGNLSTVGYAEAVEPQISDDERETMQARFGKLTEPLTTDLRGTP